MNITSAIFPNSILVLSLIYNWHELLEKKIDYKNKKLYFSILSIMIISIMNYLLTDKFIKIVFITVVFMFFIRYIFKCDIRTSIVTPIYYQLIIMISEGLCILFLTSLLKLSVDELKDKFLGSYLVVNIITAILSIVIIKIPFVKKIYKSIVNNLNRISIYFILIFSIIIIGISNILAMLTYFTIDIRMIVLVNIIFTLFCCFVIFYLFKIQNNYNKVNDKYNIAINSLTDYEQMMTKYRINNHENKNLLLAVRAMIINKEKDIPIYIDSIIKNKYNDNEKLLSKVNKIPSGGLRATIYSEILKIKDKDINYELIIDNSIKTIDLINLDTNTIIDICKIIGVFIDNAIEEVLKIENKHIGISLYTNDDEFIIEVSNTYKNIIEINKIYNEGYTTKGKDHGYGLSLVKKIIDSNNNFENKIRINKNVFTQVLLIQYKKSHK